MRNSSLSVDGAKIHVVESGEGNPLLLIHGLGGPLMWQRVIEPLAQSFHVIVVDLSGYGDSESPNRTYSVTDHADLLRQILQQIGIIKANVAGISYGGQIAATFASCYPEMIERLVLVCSTGLMKTPFVLANSFLRSLFSFIAKNFVLTNEKLLCRTGARSFYNVANRPADLCHKYFEQLSMPGHHEAWLNGFVNSFSGGEEFKKHLGKISAPTLILWGENDKTVPPAYALEFQRLIRGSRVQMFKECGHSVPLEKPEESCDTLKKFIGE